MANVNSCYHELGFAESPFNLTPDTAFFFQGRQHVAALNHLQYGLQTDGFTMLTGEIGLGKTLLCRQLLSSVPKGIKTVYIYNTYIDFMDLLKAIYQDITGIHLEDASYSKLFNEINQILIRIAKNGEKVVVILDEAQRLKPRVLEGLRLLSNLETQKHKLLSFIMVGQPELETRLVAKNLRPLAQRISVKFRLKPLGYRDTRDYINHRLRAATTSGGSPSFSEPALFLAHRFSGGTPRRINQICDRALLSAYAGGKMQIGYRMLLNAAREIVE